MAATSSSSPSAEVSLFIRCDECHRIGTLELDEGETTTRVRCRDCGTEYALARHRKWTLVDPSGTVRTFDSAAELRGALSDTPDAERGPGDDEDLVSVAEGPLRIAPIPPVPSAEAALHLTPPPPPRRSSSPTMPIPAAEAASSAAAVVLPKPSPLPPPSDANLPARTETIRGIGEPPPISEPAIFSLREAFARGGDDDLIEEADDDEVPVSEEAPFPLQRASRSSGSAIQATAPIEGDDAASTRAPTTSSLAETVKRRRWTEPDAEALALPPSPRRGGWIVAAALVAGAAGLVTYLHQSSAIPEARQPASVIATEHAAATDPARGPDEERTSSNGGPLPTALVEAPAVSPAAPGTDLVAPSIVPVSITTTTNAKTLVTSAGPVANAEPISEDLLPLNELLRRAQLSLTEGDRGRAQQRFRLALAKDPSNVEASTGLGDIARSEGDLDGARDHYQRALDRSPSFVPALLAAADLEWDLGKRGDAQKKYAAIVDRLGDRAPARAQERKAEDAP